MSQFLRASGSNQKRGILLLLLQTLTVLLSVCVLSAVSWSDQTLTAHGTIIDDGFYALTVSRNIALGRGITADGSALTNGFQPLWVFLLVPAFLVAQGDRLFALRIVLGVSSLLMIATAFLLGLIAREVFIEPAKRKLAFWLAAFLCLSNYIVWSTYLNGLETGLQILLLCAVIRCLQTGDLNNTRQLGLAGALLGALVLARIDAVFLVGVVCVYLLSYPFQHSLVDRAMRSAVVAGGALLISSPWWLYNVSYFGSLMPSSGRAQQGWAFSATRLDWALRAFLTSLVPVAPIPAVAQFRGVQLVRLLLLGGTLLYVGLPFAKRRGRWQELSPLMQRTLTIILLVGVAWLLLFGWYTLSSFAVWQYQRYFAPTTIIFIVTAALLFTEFAELVSRGPQVLGAIAVALSLTVPLRTVFAYEVPGHGQSNFVEQLNLVQQWVPDSAYVAAGQSGTLGFFRDNVINLDGKVNQTVLDYHPWDSRQSTVYRYLQEQQIHYVCDWSTLVPVYLGASPASHGWQTVARSGDFVLYSRSPMK